jgi:O-antigen ligase
MFVFKMSAAISLSNKLLKISVFLALILPICLFLGNAAPDIVISTIAILFLISQFITKDFSWLKESWVKAALAFWGYLIIRSFFAEFNQEALSRALPIGRLFMFSCALIYWVLPYRNTRKNMVFSLIATIALVCVDVLVQYVYGIGLFGNAKVDLGGLFYRLTNFVGKMSVGITLAMITFPANLYVIENYILSSRYGVKVKILSTLFIIITVVVIFISGERSAFLTTLLGYLIILVLYKPFRKFFILFLLGISLVIGAFFMQDEKLLYRQFEYAHSEISNFPQSVYARLFSTGFKIFKENMVFGVGPKHFRYECDDLVQNNPDKYETYGNDIKVHYSCATHPHNIYIELLSETGFVGFGLFSLMLFYLAQGFWSARKIIVEDVVCLGGIVNIILRLLPFIPTGSFFVAWTTIPMWLMVGLVFHRIKKFENIKD